VHTTTDFALAEGITSQFDLAILVVRLVHMLLMRMATPRPYGDSTYHTDLPNCSDKDG
jgi:hypothetical protein